MAELIGERIILGNCYVTVRDAPPEILPSRDRTTSENISILISRESRVVIVRGIGSLLEKLDTRRSKYRA